MEEQHSHPKSASRRKLWVGATVLAVGLGSGATMLDLFPEQAAAQDAPNPIADSANRATATVTRGDLTTQRTLRAAISFGESWSLNTDASGTITSAPDVGSVVDFGEELLRINNAPIFLAEGTMPMYRELYRVHTNKQQNLINGPDVAQLQTFLINAGHDGDGTLKADGFFGKTTEKALRSWQKSHGLEETGRISKTRVIFSQTPVRINKAQRIGAEFSELEVTKAGAVVTVDTAAKDRSLVSEGSSVTIVLPDGQEFGGTIASQSPTTNADGAQIWRSEINAVDLPADAGSPSIRVDSSVASGVLLVPASSLLALAEGGFAVEIPEGTGAKLVRVELGAVLEGQAEISGDDISEGTKVVIPS